jgi:hypothetical protein
MVETSARSKNSATELATAGVSEFATAGATEFATAGATEFATAGATEFATAGVVSVSIPNEELSAPQSAEGVTADAVMAIECHGVPDSHGVIHGARDCRGEEESSQTEP